MDAPKFWGWLGMPGEADAAAAPQTVGRAAAELMSYEGGADGLGTAELRYVLNAFNRRNTPAAVVALLDQYGRAAADGARRIPRGRYDELRAWLDAPEEAQPTGDVTGAAARPVRRAPPEFDTQDSGLTERWKLHMTERVPVQAPQGCGQASGLMLNQQSVMRYVGAIVAQWRQANLQWSEVTAAMPRFDKCGTCGGRAPGRVCEVCASAPGPGRYGAAPRPLAPPPHRGLLAAHNVGAGKTAIALGVALYARRAWPDCTVIIAAEDADAQTLSASLPGEYKRFPEFGIDRQPSASLVKASHTLAVGPVKMPVTCYTFPPACDELRPMADGSPSVMVWSLETTMKDSLVTRSDGPRARRDRYGVVVVDADNAPVLAAGRERDLKPHWSRAPCTRSGERTCLGGARRMPDGPVVLLIDEGHNLAVREGTATRLENYAVMREFLGSPASRNVYRILLTATPGSTPREVTELASLVAPDTEPTARVLRALGGGSDDPHDHMEFERVMRGCVDVWQTLGNAAVYPTLRFADDRVPFQNKDVAARHVRDTCHAARGYSVAAAADALRTDDGFRPYAAHVAKLHTASASADTVPIDDVLMHAVTDARGVAEEDERDGGAGRGMEETREGGDGGGSSADALRGPELARQAVRALAAARTHAQFTPELTKGAYNSRPERIKKKLRGADGASGLLGASAEALRAAARRGDAAPPDCPLAEHAPRLALLAMELLRPVASPNDTERAVATQPGRYMPACKQLVVVPLLPSQKERYPQQLFVQYLLETVCGLAPLRWGEAPQPGRQYYISTRNKDVHLQLSSTGCGGCTPDGQVDVARCGVFNLPSNMYGEAVPVVLIHDAKRTTAYSLQALQRIHLTDWCDPTVAAQAMGRAQRPFAAEKLPANRRRVQVLTYSLCPGDAGSGASSAAGGRAWDTVQRAVAAEGGGSTLAPALQEAATVLQQDATEAIDRSALLERGVHLARTVASQPAGLPMTQSDYQLLLYLALDLDPQRTGSSIVPLPAEVRQAMRQLPMALRNTIPWGDRVAAERAWPTVEAARSSPLLRPVGATVADVLQRESLRARQAGYLDQSIAAALATVLSWRADGAAPAAAAGGLDEALARAHAIPYTPVLQLYRGLMAASVSCSLYAAIHAAFGQLPGMPAPCGIPQEVACVGASEKPPGCGPGDGDADANQAFSAVAKPPPDGAVAELRAAIHDLRDTELPDGAGLSTEYGRAMRDGDTVRSAALAARLAATEAERARVLRADAERRHRAARRIAALVGAMIGRASDEACAAAGAADAGGAPDAACGQLREAAAQLSPS